jgi:hypothetical protein
MYMVRRLIFRCPANTHEVDDAGHAAQDDGITGALIRAADEFAARAR